MRVLCTVFLASVYHAVLKYSVVTGNVNSFTRVPVCSLSPLAGMVVCMYKLVATRCI